jgi:ribosomal protein S18 acetylase RimI-like enzyme
VVLIRTATVADAAGIGRVHAESWRTTYRGIVPDEYLDAIDVGEWSERQRRNMVEAPDDQVSLVGEIEGEIVAWAVAGPNRGPRPDHAGELYAIYLLPEHQRQGVGIRLTVAAAGRLREVGIGSMVVWVLARNHQARAFYEALGATYYREREVEVGGARLSEVSYGWSDLGPLCQMPFS